MQNTSPAFRLSAFVLLVSDIGISRDFYRDVLGQEIALDLGINVGFTSGLALWERDYALNVIHGPGIRPRKGNNVEIYFETGDLDRAWERVRESGAEVIHELREQPWCQRVFRIADPDQFVIEIAEPMDAAVRRLHSRGLLDTAIAEKTSMPVAVVRQILTDRATLAG